MYYRNHCTWESPKLQLHDTVHVLVFLASPFCKIQLTANCLNLTHDYCILHTPGHCMAPGGFEMRMLQGIFLQRYVYDYNYVGLCTPFLFPWHCFPPLFCSAGISNSCPSNTYIWETQLHVLTITVYYMGLCGCVCTFAFCGTRHWQLNLTEVWLQLYGNQWIYSVHTCDLNY